ncbi:ankyrin repeat domain-containing protein [Leptospira interrogans]|uniref:ankyrin repeat domain-containing protein n=1 Tax=Leptospira interrogans TaxID=173 RepID=UPI003EB9BE91
MKLLSSILNKFRKNFCKKDNIKYIHFVFGTSLFFTMCAFPQERSVSYHPTDYVYKDDLQGLQNCLRLGRGVDQRDPFFKNYTPLMIAAKEGEYLISEYLIRHGADVNARTRDGHTALMMATFNRYPEIVKLLIRSGADVHAMTLQGHTAWSESTLENRKIIQELLIKAGAGTK